MNQKSEEEQVLQPFDNPNASLMLGQSTDPAIVAAAEAAKQRIQCAYIIAIQNPRNLESVRQRMLANCRRPKFAEVAEYSKPVSSDRSKDITGPSIRFVEMAIREWGNCNADVVVEYEDAVIRRVKVYITDYQTNVTFTKSITIRKEVERKKKTGRTVVSERKNSYGDTVYTVVATDDELLNKEAALISKAIRTEGLRIIPGDFVEECLDEAKKVLEGQVKDDIVEERRKILDAFVKIGVSIEQLEEYLDCKIDAASPAQIIKLRKIWTAISGEGATWGDFMAKKKEGTDVTEAPGAKKTGKKTGKKAPAAAKTTPPKPAVEPKAPTSAKPPVGEEATEPPETAESKAWATTAPPEEQVETETDPENVGSKEKLEKLCMDQDISWAQVQKWGRDPNRGFDVSKDDDCAKIINAWDQIHPFIKTIKI